MNKCKHQFLQMMLMNYRNKCNRKTTIMEAISSSKKTQNIFIALHLFLEMSFINTEKLINQILAD